MRLRVFTAAAFLATLVPYLQAEDTGSVTGTVTVTGGTLSITVPDAAALGSVSPGGDLSASMGTVDVADRRGVSTAAWAATVTSAGFTTGGGGPGEVIPAGSVDYWSGPATTTEGDGSFVPGQQAVEDAVSLGTSPVAFSLTGGDGGNSASWTPTLIVHIPAGAVAGDYSGEVVHSVT